ncbi:MAG: hypothetical protein QOI98_621 [Solirubrobacteraceae bacterium]|nr:hypothetical protein [Solirubrobacteraceae bacterium]
MRRSHHQLIVFALTAVTVFGSPAGALAKGEPMGVRLESSTRDLRAGQPWDLTFTVLAAPAAQRWREPAVWIESRGLDSPDAFFDATPTGRPGQYRARVTFPTAGRWTYTVGEREGRFFDFGPVRVRTAASGSRTASLGATPLAAIAALFLAGGGAAMARRRRSPG